MKYGLSQTVIAKVCAVFARFVAIEKAVLYGSRAKGNFKAGSDIDLTLFGGNLKPSQSGEIAEALDDLLLPYTFDLSLYAELNHAKLREHIDRVGVVFYERSGVRQHQAGALKKGWPWKPLGEVCKTGSGGTPLSSRKEYYEGGKIPWLLSGEVAQGNVREAKNFITKAGLENSAAKLFPKDTVLVAMYGATAGQVGILRFEAATNQAVCGILPNDNFVPEFLFYFLLAKKDELVAQATGNAQPNISQIKIKNTEVPVPPLPEQQRIVGLLDEAFEGLATAKANAKKNLQNARALFESHLQSVFTQRGTGWVDKSVSELAKHSLGKMLDKAKNKGEPQPYLRNINVRWFTFDLSDLLQMPFLAAETEKYTAVKGDVLICEGGYPGRAAIWDEEYPIYFQKALHRVRFHEREHNKWFVYYLSVQDSSGQLKQHFSGTGIQHFTGEVLARFAIPVPPLPELRRAVAKFDALSEETQRLARLYEQKLAALEALKKSLLHQAFSGQL